MSAPFSRLQLAAALLEYDNDPDNPDAPYRSAHESALFAHLRRNIRGSQGPRRSSNYVGVALPSETGSVGGGRESVMDGRRSRGSTLALRNPFGEDDCLEDEQDSTGQMEVDLTSWGLDAFISKDSGKPASASPQPLSSVPRMRTTRSMSVDHLPEQDTTTSPLDLAAFQRRRAASYSFDNAIHAPEGPPIPFPSRSVHSPSPPLDARTHSALLSDNPRQRSNSNGTMASRMLDSNPFTLDPPTKASRFDPKAAAHARTMSNASMSTQMLLNDNASVMTGQGLQQRPLSTMDLLRPKVLVMPSPLQALHASVPHSPELSRDGFQITTDGPPLPPGARSARDRYPSAVPIASNSFTPNPHMNMTLSQMTFRNTLKVDGREAYSDTLELPRATEDGQQIDLDAAFPEETQLGQPPDENAQPGRPPGKLFGKSLIDDLESRKAKMRSKQRVFRGDDRPSMMARGQLNRSSTFIDPASLPARPGNQRMGSYASSSGRPLSTGPGPLLDLEGDHIAQVKLQPPGARPPNARSVFGVDTLWEREMAKLKEIEVQEAQEKLEREEHERRVATSSLKPKKKGKRGYTDPQPESPTSELQQPTSHLSSPPIASSSPPILPLISPMIRGPPPVVDDDSSDSESDDGVPQPALSRKKEVNDWHSDSSEDQGPRKTTGVGLRNPTLARTLAHPPPQPLVADDESEDDLPLSAAIQRATLRAPTRGRRDSDSDEDKPLSVLIRKSQSTSVLLPKLDFDQPVSGDDDDQPLGLRASRVAPSIRAPSFVGEEGDDDERPLGLHPDQQRRSHFVMLQQAQQQQQMLLQAQMQSSMFMNQSMMGSTFFPPPMAPMPMMAPLAPIQVPSPPPLQDPAKFGGIDRWRRDIVVDAE